MGVMRRVRCLWVAGALAVSGVALAGPLAVEDPFDVASCGETDYAATLGDPNGAYSLLTDCPGLCRLAEAECRKLTKLSFSCHKLIVTKRAVWSKANCVATITDDSAALKSCKLAAKDQAAADKQSVKGALSDALGACSDWSTTCQSSCGLP